MSQEKYIGMDVHQASISVAVMDAQGKLIMEMPAGDQSEHDHRVHPRAAGNSVAYFRGRNVRCLVTRSSETPRQPAGGLRSAQECPVERGQQERPDRRAQAGRVVTHQPTQLGLPRRAWDPHLERTGAQLSDDHQRCDSRDESDQIPVPQLGHSL